jgi:hypothetical protein
MTANAACPPTELTAIARGIRFALVCILLSFCYSNISTSLNIKTYADMYKNTQGSKPAPALRSFVMKSSQVFIALSIVFAVCAVATLFDRSLIHSFYAIGILYLLTSAQLSWVSHCLFTPLSP